MLAPSAPDTTPTMARRTKEEALQTRQALLDAAEVVFEARGVDASSLQEVAEAAGVTRGAVYWHFRDKADLVNALMDRATLPFEQQWQRAEAAPGTDPLATLQALLTDILRTTARDERLQRAIAISTQKLAYVDGLDAVRARRLRVLDEAQAQFDRLLRAAARRGRLAAGVRTRDAARALLALIDGLIVQWMLDRDAFDLCKVGEPAVERMLAGLAGAPAVPDGPTSAVSRRPAARCATASRSGRSRA